MAYEGLDRRSDDHGERLARIEEGIKGLGRSMDQMRTDLGAQRTEQHKLEADIEEIKQEMAQVKGGYRMFWKMCGAIAVVVGAIWTLAAVVFKQ